MSSKRIRFEKTLTYDEIQPLYEALQSCLAKADGGSDAFEPAGVKKAEISVKKEDGGYYKLKVKLKYLEAPCDVSACHEAEPGEGDAAEDDNGNNDDEADKCAEATAGGQRGSQGDKPKPRYKTLKKGMSKDFDIIKKNVKDGKIPPLDTVKKFMEDAQMMCRFRDKGEKHYKAFLAACDGFQKAFEAGDLEGIRNHTQSLRSLEKSCHSEYKEMP